MKNAYIKTMQQLPKYHYMNVYLTTYDGYIVVVEDGKISAYEGVSLCPPKVKKWLETHRSYQLDYYYQDAIANGRCK